VNPREDVPPVNTGGLFCLSKEVTLRFEKSVIDMDSRCDVVGLRADSGRREILQPSVLCGMMGH